MSQSLNYLLKAVIIKIIFSTYAKKKEISICSGTRAVDRGL